MSQTKKNLQDIFENFLLNIQYFSLNRREEYVYIVHLKKKNTKRKSCTKAQACMTQRPLGKAGSRLNLSYLGTLLLYVLIPLFLFYCISIVI